MATLILLHGSTPDREIEIGERTLRLGRGDQNDVVLPDPGKSVSRFHAELRVEQGRFIVVDLNSQNGVWVGGRRVPQAALEPGVPVVLGTYQLILLKPERLAQPDASDATVVTGTGTPPLVRQATEIAPMPAPVPPAPPKPAAPAKPAPSVKPPAPRETRRAGEAREAGAAPAAEAS